VAHYAPFELGVIHHACDDTRTPRRELRYACTCQLARMVWPGRACYSLPAVADLVGIEGLNHHDASSDAWDCASIAEAAVRERGVAGLPELLDQMSIFPGHLAPGLFDRADHGLNHLPRKPTAGSTPDPDHPFYGRKLVLTGGLGSISRHDAQQAIIDVGGKPSTSVSKFTDFLVVGGEFHGLLRNHQSHKLESALALRAQGASIELLNERDFLSTLLGGS